MKGPVKKALAEFKKEQAEDPSALLWFQSNPHIQKLIMCWGKISINQTDTGEKPPKNSITRWKWLWTHYEYSAIQWIELAGIMDRRYGLRLVERLINLRLVFPDGTLPEWITRFLNLSAELVIARATPEPKTVPEPEGDEDE